MTLMRFDPFRELDRLADQALAGPRTMLRTMPMEAVRRDDQFIVAIDLPGVAQDDVDVTVERNVIDVSARRQPVRKESDQVIIDERPRRASFAVSCSSVTTSIRTKCLLNTTVVC
jgi:HSP20 family protein